MRSSIFNSNVVATLAAVITAAATVLLAWAVIPAHLSFDNQAYIFGPQTLNELVLESYRDEYKTKPIVFVGSSILTEIPPPGCLPDDVASIYLQGLSGHTGLDAIRRLGAVPRVLFIEVPTLLLGADQDLLNSVFMPVYWHIQSEIPSLRLSRNWIVLFYRWLVSKRWADSNRLEYPPLSLEEWNKLMAPRFELRVQPFSDSAAVTAMVAGIAPQLRKLQEHGTRVIFYNPADPRIRSLQHTEFEAEITAQLPGTEYVDAPDDQFPIYRLDGLHFTDASGFQFFDYLMKYAGLPFTSDCQIVSKPLT